MDIIGYSDKFTIQPGQTIRFMVSCRHPSYRADIVRLIHGDDNPKGPGFKQQMVEDGGGGEYPGRVQPIHCGSYAIVPYDPAFDGDRGLALTAWVYPTTPGKGTQGIVTRQDVRGVGYAMFVDAQGGLAFATGNAAGGVETMRSGVPMLDSRWYFVAATFDPGSGIMRLWQQLQTSWPVEGARVMIERNLGDHRIGSHRGPLLIAACSNDDDQGGPPVGCHLNGKIENPRLYNTALAPDQIEAIACDEPVNETPAAAWDFSLDPSTDRITDASGHHHHGRVVQLPARGVTSHRWSGDVINAADAPDQYAAIYFHDDDLEDARWDEDFVLTIPDSFPSGVYAAWLQTGEGEDHVPFFVRPKRGRRSAGIAFLAPTLTYLAYANHVFNNDPHGLRDAQAQANIVATRPRDQFMAEQKLLSLYDQHSDGSAVAYGSSRRPLVDIRPKHTLPHGSLAASWPHGLNADLHLVDWLETKGFRHDVVTDEALHHEGAELLESYKVIITGTHPEYWTAAMLDGLDHYLSHGGRLMYLGGNGFYWVTSIDPQRPHIVEVRRWGGSQSWQAPAGEYYHSSTAELGGLWRLRNRPPQKLVGVGFTSQGGGTSHPYRRQPGSFDPRAAFIFEGVGRDELIGNFDSLVLGHGAAGYELDRFDHALGTPAHALLLASSFGHGDTYSGATEDGPQHAGRTHEGDDPLLRSDMVYFEGPRGGAVFSVGSIAWCGCLSYNDCDNNVSRITENVLRRYLY